MRKVKKGAKRRRGSKDFRTNKKEILKPTFVPAIPDDANSCLSLCIGVAFQIVKDADRDDFEVHLISSKPN